MSDWRDRAACLGHDPELWFPLDRGSHAIAARLICSRCPVVDDCLGWALRTGQEYGVWGGQSVVQRRALRRNMSTADVSGGAG